MHKTLELGYNRPLEEPIMPSSDDIEFFLGPPSTTHHYRDDDNNDQEEASIAAIDAIRHKDSPSHIELAGESEQPVEPSLPPLPPLSPASTLHPREPTYKTIMRIIAQARRDPQAGM